MTLAESHDGTLTPRQAQILGLLADGYSQREIARRLWLGIETVRWHTKCTYRALGVHSRADALAFIRHPDGISVRCPTCRQPIARHTANEETA